MRRRESFAVAAVRGDGKGVGGVCFRKIMFEGMAGLFL